MAAALAPEGTGEVATTRLPLRIVFPNLPRSDAIEAKIRAYADRLDDFYSGHQLVGGCH